MYWFKCNVNQLPKQWNASYHYHGSLTILRFVLSFSHQRRPCCLHAPYDHCVPLNSALHHTYDFTKPVRPTTLTL